MKNVNAVLKARHHADGLAESLLLAFWLKDSNNVAADYHAAEARNHFEQLARQMALTDVEFPPAEITAEDTVL